MASWEEGSADEKEVATKSVSSRGSRNCLDLKGTLTFRATGHF
jgi:hypothetical protein